MAGSQPVPQYESAGRAEEGALENRGLINSRHHDILFAQLDAHNRFSVKTYPSEYFRLGAHFDCFLGSFDLVLHKTLVFGFPPVPFSKRPHLIVSTGEINGLVEKYSDKQVAFIISTMARGGFSGGPVLVAYDEENQITGTALLGVVTESLTKNYDITESGFMAVTTIQPIHELLEQHKLLPDYQKVEI